MTQEREKYTAIIDPVIKHLRIEKEPMDVEDVIEKLQDAIVNSHTELPTRDDWKSDWINHIKLRASELAVALSSKKPNWKVIDRRIQAKFAYHNASKTPSPLAKSTTASKSNSCELTPEAKAEFLAKHASMIDSKKWKLRNGSYVEDLIVKHIEDCTHEHPSHSFILSIDDPCWKKVFMDSMDEITVGCELPDLSEQVTALLNNFEYVSQAEDPLEFLISTTNSLGPYDVRTDYDLWWLLSAINQFTSYYAHATLDSSTEWSEMDYATKLWGILDHAFENISVFAGRDRTSSATSKRVNAGRLVTGSAIERKQKSTRPDLVLLKNKIEYGCAEVGKDDCIGSNTKNIIESQLLTPKTMKDMFNMAVENANNNATVTHSLKIVGFNHTGLKMKMSIMDCPSGYVCRLVKTLEYEVPKRPELGFRDLLAILRMTLKAKLLVKNSMDLLEGYRKEKASNPVLEIMDNSDKIYLPTCLSAPLVPVAKRRRLDSDALTTTSPSGSSS